MNAPLISTQPRCWLECARLWGEDMEDSPHCASRADEGIDAISTLSLGMLGRFSHSMFEVIQALAALGYDPTRLHAMPYDFRLTPDLLETRDGYFSNLKRKIEFERKRLNKRSVIITHSLGCKIFQYFLAWLEKYDFKDEGKEAYLEWVDENIGFYFSNGDAVLGSPDIATSIVVGDKQGMPISLKYIHEVLSSAGGILSLAPVEEKDGLFEQGPWIKLMKTPELEAIIGSEGPYEFGPQIGCDDDDNVLPGPTTKQNLANKARGSLLDFLEKIGAAVGDSHLTTSASYVRRLCNDPFVGNVFDIGRERPPIDLVHVAYGVGQQTRVSTTFELLPGKSAQTEPYFAASAIDPEIRKAKYTKETRTWRVAGHVDEVGVKERALVDENGRVISESSTSRGGKAGDQTVPYASLSAAHKWLGDDESKVTVRTVPLRKKFLVEEVMEGPYDKVRRAPKSLHHSVRRNVSSLENNTTCAAKKEIITDTQTSITATIIASSVDKVKEATVDEDAKKTEEAATNPFEENEEQEDHGDLHEDLHERRHQMQEQQKKKQRAAAAQAEEKLSNASQAACAPGDDSKRCLAAFKDEPRATIFEASSVDYETGEAKRTSIAELEGVSHRTTANHPVRIEFFQLLMIDEVTRMRDRIARDGRDDFLLEDVLEGDVSANLVEVADFLPTDDSECFWSFPKATCAYSGICEYQYKVGDLYLSQSCRLKRGPAAADGAAIPKVDSDCYWSFPSAACAYPGICEYQYQVGDLYLSQSCRLIKKHKKDTDDHDHDHQQPPTDGEL